MVQKKEPISITNRVIHFVKNDFRDFSSALNSYKNTEPGLYTYRIKRPQGGYMRIHLRIEPDGRGVLFVDVTDVIHLNQIAAEIAMLALENVRRKTAYSILKKKYRSSSNMNFREEVEKIYRMIDHFQNHTGDCFTCALSGDIDMAPIFSVPVNAPYKIDIALTYGCNNECPHCYNEVDRLPMPSLPLADWYRVFDKVASLGIPHVILTGGEATLHPDLPKVIQYADQLGMIVGMNTNGRRLAHLPYMKELAEAGLNHVQFTLGSNHAEIHNAVMGADSFNQTVKGIKNALETNVHVITNTTLMRSNMGHVSEIINYIYNLGIRTFAMNGMIYSGGGFAHPNAIPEDELAPLLIQIRDHAQDLGMRFLWYSPTEYCCFSPVELEIGAKRCNAGEYSICIEPNGDVLPCQSYYVSAGNILNDPWEKIWKSDLFRSFRERGEAPGWAGLPEMCWDCLDLPICGGGCRIEREAREGIRIANNGGGGCVGCTTYSGPESKEISEDNQIEYQWENESSFIPLTNQTRTTSRSTGNLPLINLEE